MMGRIDHVGIVVSNTRDALTTYQHILGLQPSETHEHPREQVKITFLRAGDTLLELIEPTSEDTGVARFLATRGSGMHHVCFEVDDIEAEMARLREAGLQVLDETPRQGMHGERLAFVHPRSAHGVLVELYEAGTRHESALTHPSPDGAHQDP
jgi:methylmalonyl-CoA/ethylmalonyl-CoA epimerase